MATRCNASMRPPQIAFGEPVPASKPLPMHILPAGRVATTPARP
jgi:hypothetical protein